MRYDKSFYCYQITITIAGIEDHVAFRNAVREINGSHKRGEARAAVINQSALANGGVHVHSMGQLW